jgi:hypothetical protein
LNDLDRVQQFSQSFQCKNSVCTGTITESEAVSAFTVIKPKEGEQSMMMGHIHLIDQYILQYCFGWDN